MIEAKMVMQAQADIVVPANAGETIRVEPFMLEVEGVEFPSCSFVPRKVAHRVGREGLTQVSLEVAVTARNLSGRQQAALLGAVDDPSADISVGANVYAGERHLDWRPAAGEEAQPWSARLGELEFVSD